MFSVEYDSAAGIVRCTSNGFFSVAQMREHARVTREAVAKCQRDFGNVAMLVLSTQTNVQTAEVMDRARAEQWHSGPADRMAIVLPSALARLQAARAFVTDRERTFPTEREAMDWLASEFPRLRANAAHA